MHTSIALSVIMSLQACTNIGLADQLESPGTTGAKNSGTSTLFVFGTTTGISGDLTQGSAFASARAGADNFCMTARSGLVFPDNGCTQVRAMISLSTADSIANMPGNYNIPTNRSINAPNNFVVAPDWFTLISGTSGNIVGANGILPAATVWWTFSTTGGNFDGTNNCVAGTSPSGASSGARADSSTSGSTWIADGLNTCSTSNRLLCICY